MEIIPAIDILQGKVVRLTRGDYNKVKVYSEDAADVAFNFAAKGADLIHVVDLEGAKEGHPVNLETVKKILNKVPVRIELGGGIRDLETIYNILEMGVERVVLGSAVYKDPDFGRNCIEEFGDKIAIGLDVKNKNIAVEGWTKEIKDPMTEIIAKFESLGLKRIIYTDVLKDGMMEGPNIEGLTEVLKNTKMEVIASGGVAAIKDILNLKKLEVKGLTGVIIGKAIYEGSIKLEEAVNVG